MNRKELQKEIVFCQKLNNDLRRQLRFALFGFILAATFSLCCFAAVTLILIGSAAGNIPLISVCAIIDLLLFGFDIYKIVDIARELKECDEIDKVLNEAKSKIC